MKVKLNFNWPGTIWITSDLHFNHENLLKFERTEFATVKEHNEFIIKQLRQKVGKNDTLVCLGDLGFDYEEWMVQLPGYKVLIKGNHDKYSDKKYKEIFNEVYEGPLFINQYIVISHEPIPATDYFINIHGHLHNANLDSSRHINASIAMANYEPLNLSKIYSTIFPIKKIREESFMSEWYANLYKFKNRDLLKINPPCFSDGHILPNASFLMQYCSSYLEKTHNIKNINFSEINFDLVDIPKNKNHLYLPSELKEIDKLLDAYAYKKEVLKFKSQEEQLLSIFNISKIEDAINKKIYGFVEGWNDDLERTTLLEELTINNIENGKFFVKLKTRTIESTYKQMLQEFGLFWFVNKEDAELYYKLNYSLEGEIRKNEDI